MNGLRVEKAKALLRDTDLKIYEIAEKVGIENANYLGIVFKKKVGLFSLRIPQFIQKLTEQEDCCTICGLCGALPVFLNRYSLG